MNSADNLAPHFLHGVNLYIFSGIYLSILYYSYVKLMSRHKILGRSKVADGVGGVHVWRIAAEYTN